MMLNEAEMLEAEMLEFITLLKDVSFSLETLAQIQACASGMSMESRSSETFERKIFLDTFIARIENIRKRQTK